MEDFKKVFLDWAVIFFTFTPIFIYKERGA